MSSTAVLGFIKDITAKNVKAVNERLKKEKPNQKYPDPSQQGLLYTLLHKAVAVGCIDIASALLKAGADVNARDSNGRTPLFWAAGQSSESHLKVAELLLRQKGIDIHAAADSKATPLHEAAACGNVKCLELLLSKGASPTDNGSGYSPLHGACQACKAGKTCLPVVELLLQAAPELLQQQDATGCTPLMVLLRNGLWTDAKLMLAKGDCNINAKGEAGETALLLACGCPAPDLQLVADLLAAGASAAVQDCPAGNTPLLLAVKQGGGVGLALAKLLLQATRSNVDAANAAGDTAVKLAATAALAAAAGAKKPAAASTDVAFGMLQLVVAQKPAVTEELGITLLIKGLTGVLPDTVTAQLVSLMSCAAVERAAAAASLPQPLTFTGLLGCKLYHTAVAHLVKTTGKDPGAPQDAAGNTHLHNAVAGTEDLPELVAALIAVGLAVDAANTDGDTALHVAARSGHVQACRALVAAGANVMRRNNKNRIPGKQLKLLEQTRQYLAEAEEAARCAKDEKDHQLWDAKMRATQTASAFGIRVT